jgi:hypothetical protein
VEDNLNAEATCSVKYGGFIIGAFFGGNFMTSTHLCKTPLGGRFKLKGLRAQAAIFVGFAIAGGKKDYFSLPLTKQRSLSRTEKAKPFSVHNDPGDLTFLGAGGNRRAGIAGLGYGFGGLISNVKEKVWRFGSEYDLRYVLRAMHGNKAAETLESAKS